MSTKDLLNRDIGLEVYQTAGSLYPEEEAARTTRTEAKPRNMAASDVLLTQFDCVTMQFQPKLQQNGCWPSGFTAQLSSDQSNSSKHHGDSQLHV